jgi:hypothetical protein
MKSGLIHYLQEIIEEGILAKFDEKRGGNQKRQKQK